MASQKQDQQAHRSIRSRVTMTMAVCFVVMFALLYVVFSLGMRSMLTDRENDAMVNQADMARNMLLMSVGNLPTLTKEWADVTYTYDYAIGENDIIYQNNFLPNRSYDLNELNLLTVLDTDNQVLFQKFYDYGNHREVQHDADLQDFYDYFGDSAYQKYEEAVASDDPSLYPMHVEGFLSKEGNVYYFSAYPITDLYGGRPFAGTFLFGRIIDNEELDAMTENINGVFTVTDSSNLDLELGEIDALISAGSYVSIEEHSATAYAAFDNIYGQPNLFVTVTDSRSMYAAGQSFINYVIFVAALGCVVVLLVIINLLNRIVLDPLASLAHQVEGIDMESHGTALNRNDRDREFFHLTGAINNMLVRIKTDRDVIQKKNDSLFYNANYDDLTGLRNRSSIMRLLDEDINNATRDAQKATVYYFDLDRFKYINDTLGHAMGDDLILQIARRLMEKLAVDETILGRMGGDKFIAIAKGLHNEYRQKEFAERIFSVFLESFTVKERAVDISISIGSSTYPDDGQDAETLVKNAEIAMYQVKESGGGFYTAYESEFHKSLHRRVFIENQLRASINNGCKDFQAYFQPKVSVPTGRIDQCEALIRWVTEDGVILPGEFIPQAEESGLIVPLTWWMIHECCRQGRIFADHGIPMHIAINVPAQVLTHDEFVDRIRGAVLETGMDIKNLDIEITEGTLLEDTEKVNEVFGKLHALGAEISVDDFGTGYSSLSYLNRLAIDRIKIDRSFVAGMDDDEDSCAIVRAVVAMANSLHMTVTAEGVEKYSQYEFLKEIGCEEIQGFLVSRPIPAEQYIDFVKHWRGIPQAGDDGI